MRQRIAIVQRDIAWCDAKANCQAIEAMLEGIDADVVVLAEMFQTGFVVRPDAVADSGETLEWMLQLSRRKSAAVVGSVAVAGVGGFALFWFVIKKKSWAEFLAIFKKK